MADLCATDPAEFVVTAMGKQGPSWDGASSFNEEMAAGRRYPRVKSSMIAGGSTAVRNNAITERIRGLPDPIRPTV